MNKYTKIGFALMAVGAIAPIVLDQLTHQLNKLSARLEISTKFNAELIAGRKAHEMVREMIESGHYDVYADTAARERALTDDYKFFKISFIEN